MQLVVQLHFQFDLLLKLLGLYAHAVPGNIIQWAGKCGGKGQPSPYGCNNVE
jgi:hypothetical protein